MTDKEKKDDYLWWVAPLVISVVLLPFLLMYIGIPMEIAMGVFTVIVFGIALFPYTVTSKI